VVDSGHEVAHAFHKELVVGIAITPIALQARGVR
jgi:hypothetical protein